MLMNLSENIALVVLAEPQDIDGGLTADYFSMKNYGRAAIVLSFGAIASQGNDVTVYLKEATSVAGAGAQVLAAQRVYQFDATTDIATAVTLTNGTFDAEANTVYVIDVHETELTVTSDYDCLSVLIADPGVSCMCSVNAICYNAKNVKTALTN